MITALTKEQEARFGEFAAKWTAIGLSTERANRPEAELGIREAYTVAGLSAPRIVWCDSPMSQGLTRAIVFGLRDSEVKNRASVGASVRASVLDSVGASVRASVGAPVEASVWSSVGASVWASVWSSVGASVWASVWASVGASVGASVWDSVGASVGASVRASVWAPVRASVLASVEDSVGASVRASVYGQHDANWLGYYDYFKIVCGLDAATQKLCGLWRVAQSAGWWLPHQNLCWVSERHNVLHRNMAGRLHKDGGPALAYPDGWSIYALNGVRMDEKWVMTSAENIDPKEALSVENAEVRRELIRKVGVERMLVGLKHKILQKRDNYELLSIKLSDEVPDARYLKMINPSIGVFHIEGVSPECSTVEQALNWRNQNFFQNAEILT